MINKKISSIISFFCAIFVAFLPFNVIVGSQAAYFSYSTMAIPALGYQYSLLYVILYIFTKSLFSCTAPFLFLLHRLPLFIATIALKSRDFKTFMILPVCAMFAFCLHPVGGKVFYYSWYWFIPMLIYLFVKDTVYSRAFAASFIAHAVGSVVWLYTGNIPAEIWTALMPLVMVERCIMAVSMIGFIHLFISIDAWCQSKVIA